MVKVALLRPSSLTDIIVSLAVNADHAVRTNQRRRIVVDIHLLVDFRKPHHDPALVLLRDLLENLRGRSGNWLYIWTHFLAVVPAVTGGRHLRESNQLRAFFCRLFHQRILFSDVLILHFQLRVASNRSGQIFSAASGPAVLYVLSHSTPPQL